MRTVQYSLALAALAATLWACSDAGTKTEKTGQPGLTESQMIARGEYLVNSVGCDDCHSPKRMGPQGPELIPELRLSGYPSDRPLPSLKDKAPTDGWMLFGPDLTVFVGPWGVSFSANITSDGTGIGNWTENNCLTAMRTGKIKGNPGGRQMLPPMPWFSFKNFTDEDLKSILAYLKTTTPVRNVVPPPRTPAEL